MEQETLKKILDYCPITGAFHWRINMPPRGIAGTEAGGENGSGYIKIAISGKRYYAHRLAFIWMTGFAPKIVDHINQCGTDNRWENLRGVSQKQNVANVLGYSGVRKRAGKWEARYSHKVIGRFATKEEAVSAYEKERIIRGYVPPMHRKPPKPSYNKASEKKKRGYSFNGKSLSELSRETGIPQPTLYWRIIKKGIPPEKAIISHQE